MNPNKGQARIIVYNIRKLKYTTMFGLNYIKFDSMQHVILYKNGRKIKEGRGLSFFYFAPNSSIVSIPLSSDDLHFVFKETTLDFQEITIQGQVTFKVADPNLITDFLDLTVNSKGKYIKDDHEKTAQRIINEAQTASAGILQSLRLKEALRKPSEIEEHILDKISKSKAVQQLGLEILSVHVLGTTPNPEMARALEAQTRETLQKEADQAIYERRNFAVEQERMIKESELNTEIAVEEKHKQIAEKQMETDRVKQENSHELKRIEMDADIQLEQQKQQLIDLKVDNEKKEADAQEYTLKAALSAYKELDWKTLMAINNKGISAKNNIALAFRELAENAHKVGNLHISPDLLESLTNHKK